MKKYMVVTVSGTGQQKASFFEDLEAAEDYLNTAKGTMGLKAELYVYHDLDEEDYDGGAVYAFEHS